MHINLTLPGRTKLQINASIDDFPVLFSTKLTLEKQLNLNNLIHLSWTAEID